MNKFENIVLHKKIKKAKVFSINPLEITVLNSKGKKFKMLAVNEISLLRQSRQTTILNLKINGRNLVKKLVADGVLVSTPAGSTAYNLSVSGPILSLDSKKVAITPISPFRPRRWKGKVLSDKVKIYIRNMDSTKRPVAAVADNQEIRNIRNVNVISNKKIRFNILFNSKESLIKKIKLEQKKIIG